MRLIPTLLFSIDRLLKMDNWKIDDETMMKMYDKIEQQRGFVPVNEETIEVDFVSDKICPL